MRLGAVRQNSEKGMPSCLGSTYSLAPSRLPGGSIDTAMLGSIIRAAIIIQKSRAGALYSI